MKEKIFNEDNVSLGIHNIVEKAKKIAVKAHEGQVRKTDSTPYIEHPFAVADILKQYCFSDIVVSAGLVHDVLEDTEVSEAELRSQLGNKITNIILEVSENKSLEWEDRKEKYIEQIVKGSEEVKAVSVADKIHNARSLLAGYEQMGSAVWKKFNRGKEKKIWFEKTLLYRLKAVWDHQLLDEYEKLVEKLTTLNS